MKTDRKFMISLSLQNYLLIFLSDLNILTYHISYEVSYNVKAASFDLDTGCSGSDFHSPM